MWSYIDNKMGKGIIVGKVRINCRFVLCFVTFLSIVLCLTFLNADVWLLMSVVVFGILMMICINKITTNCFFMFFLCSLYIFLLSGDIAEIIFKEYYYIQFDMSATIHAHRSIFISLLFILVGFAVTPACKIKRCNIEVRQSKEPSFKSNLQFVAKLSYFATYIFAILYLIDNIKYVSDNGYFKFYSSYVSGMPMIFVKIGEFMPLTFCLFLATMPSKKESLGTIISFVVYSFISLLVGSRSTVVYNLVFIFCYFLYRNYIDKGKDVWVTKRIAYVLLLCIPFLLNFLFLYDYIRTGTDIKYGSFGDTLISFFVNIGSSSKVIKYGYIYSHNIPKYRFYSFGETLNYFKYSKLFNSGAIPSRQTAEFALESHSFSSLISYLVMPQGYLQGHGTGSSFIAELYADFGYCGIAVGSFIYGCAFKKICTNNGGSWLFTTICLFTFFDFLASPRASYDGFFACVFNLSNIAYVVLIIIISKFMTKIKGKRCRSEENLLSNRELQ